MKSRPEVIRKLSMEALAAMDQAGIDDMTSSEVISACFSMCMHVSEVMLEQSAGPEREFNRTQLLDAVTKLYNLVKPTVTN